MITQITINPSDRRTDVRFSRLLNGDFDTMLRNYLKNMQMNADVRYLEDTEFTCEYRINKRLGRKQRIQLLRYLCTEFGIDAPKLYPRKLPKSSLFKNANREDTGVIVGFVGNLLIGDHEYLYN